ncbi:MAG: glycosyltransferase [Oscillospiraceae bacterium]|nr:glycosyltransferase [Oscillospiraceae bacterium]
MEKYSVLMSLYIKDNPEQFIDSLESMLAQTVLADEIVIVCDGVLTERLDEILDDYTRRYPALFRIKRREVNLGLGRTLAEGVELCRNELIARMDADDYCVPERCEKQLKLLAARPEIDVVGSNVEEFIDSVDNVVAHVVLPETPEEAEKFAKRRCPVRHPALMYRKSSVLKAGNYRDYRRAQDYNLMVHMLLSGAKIYNIQEKLVYMRVSADFYKRRGGWNYAKTSLKLKKEFYDCGFYSKKDFLISGVGNAIVCLLPNGLRKLFYKKFLRKAEPAKEKVGAVK